jgi:hypothetical protein
MGFGTIREETILPNCLIMPMKRRLSTLQKEPVRKIPNAILGICVGIGFRKMGWRAGSSMKAALLYTGRDLRIENLDVTPPSDGEVLVRVKIAGLCGSDLHGTWGIGL